MTVAPRAFVLAAALAVVVTASGSSVIEAHPLAPALLELRETDGGTFEVRWKRPIRPSGESELAAVLPSTCRTLRSLGEEIEGAMRTDRWVVDCGPRGLIDRRVGVRGLEPGGTDALLRVAFAGGQVSRRVLRSGADTVEIPGPTSRARVAMDYVALGFRHILGGADHLLFVFGLLLLVVRFVPLLQTVTAFTIGHSVTLSLVALDVVRVSSGAVEVLIALSVFWLAVELARGPGSSPSLLRRHPWAMAATFGLLHGTGFAAALRETGLPEGELLLGMLAFNSGIELGQILFVLLALPVLAMLRQVLSARPAWADRVPIYAMGSLAAFWSFERLAMLL